MLLSLNEASCLDEGSQAFVPPLTSSKRTLSAANNPYLFPLSLLDGVSAHLLQSFSRDVFPAPGESIGEDALSGWWLVHTKPRQEKKLAHDLRALQVPHFLPAIPHRAVSRGRVPVVWAPLFPGYLFQYGGGESRINALKTNRVVAIHPVADRLRLNCQLWDLADLIEKNVPLRVEERFPIGRKVRVKVGVLIDKCGVIVRHGGKSRLFIQINELLGGVSVEIDHQLVEPY